MKKRIFNYPAEVKEMRKVGIVVRRSKKYFKVYFTEKQLETLSRFLDVNVRSDYDFCLEPYSIKALKQVDALLNRLSKAEVE